MKAIVSFANERGNYMKSLARLGDSLKNNFDGDFLAYVNEGSIGAPPHEQEPYAFKIFGIKRAIEAGYKQILWLDSSCFAIKNVQPIFDEIKRNGFIFQEAGHLASTWTNDVTLNYFNLTRDDAEKIPLIGNAGFLGFDISTTLGVEFFYTWKHSMEWGCFKGEWNNDKGTESSDPRCKGHRHDLCCSSIILYKMGLMHLAKKGDEWLQYAGPYDETANDTIIIKAQGV